MNRRLFLLMLPALCWLAFLPGQAQQPQDLPRLTLQIGKAEMSAQVANTPMQREVGLMYVTKMPDNDGMLFVMPSISAATFWMKNTLIPLSIAFLDKNGVILEIHDMAPANPSLPDIEIPRTRTASDQVAYALEANLHWFSLNGIKPGTKITVANGTLPKPVTP